MLLHLQRYVARPDRKDRLPEWGRVRKRNRASGVDCIDKLPINRLSHILEEDIKSRDGLRGLGHTMHASAVCFEAQQDSRGCVLALWQVPLCRSAAASPLQFPQCLQHEYLRGEMII